VRISRKVPSCCTPVLYNGTQGKHWQTEKIVKCRLVSVKFGCLFVQMTDTAFYQFFCKVVGLFRGSAMEVVCEVTPPHPTQGTESIQPFINTANNTCDLFLLGEAVFGVTTSVLTGTLHP